MERRAGQQVSQTPPLSQIRARMVAPTDAGAEEVGNTPNRREEAITAPVGAAVGTASRKRSRSPLPLPPATPPPQLRRGRPPGQADYAPRRREPAPPRAVPARPRAVPEPAPPRDFQEDGPRFDSDDQECPLSAADLAIKKEFDEALVAEKMTYCPRCKERWFDVKLRRDGAYCVRCHEKDHKKRGDEPFYYSAENHLDFGTVPAGLPQLEPLEETLIARVHVSVNVFTVSKLAFLAGYVANAATRFAVPSTNTAVTSFTSYVTLA